MTSQTTLYPFLFRHVYRDYIWGGCRIPEKFGRTDAPERCAESWEISGHPDGVSVVANGPLAGTRLDDLCRTAGEALVGTAAEDPTRFPLLLKLIDAKTKLSVQVHPSEETAEEVGGEPKTEMWYVLDAEPGSFMYCGLRDCHGPRAIRDALAAREMPSLLAAHPSKPGSSLFVPGGPVHAIGDGNLVFEVQQSSNTTYRLYDWDRVGADGRTRELHVEKALKVIDFRAPALGFIDPVEEGGANPRSRVLRTDFFRLEKTRLLAPETVALDGLSFHALFVLSGAARVSGTGFEPVDLPLGTSCLVPAALGSYSLDPAAENTEILTTSI